MAKIKNVKKDKDGNITHVRLSTGQVLTINQAVKRADNGNIDGVHSVHPADRDPYIRSNPDEKKKNNLDNLPEL